MRKDKLHITLRRVDSYNMPFNFVISEREAGKSVAILTKAYKLFRKKHRTTIVIKRLIADITETYIQDCGKVINKFLPKDKQVELEFKKGSIKEGVVDVSIEGKHFMRIIALSNPMSRFKSTMIKNPAMIIFDEFICNNRAGEKYLDSEAFKFKEIYNTYQRECNGYILKCYFMGNPYSLYNPYFSDLEVNTLELYPGAFVVGKNYVISCYRIKDELREAILKRNPLYQFDESYKKYAFYGQAVNDSQFIVDPVRPDKFYLRYVFRVNNRYLHIWCNNNDDYHIDCKYFIEAKADTSATRKIYAIDFNNLVQNTRLITTQLKILFLRLKQAIAARQCVFNSIEAGYLAEALYTCI